MKKLSALIVSLSLICPSAPAFSVQPAARQTDLFTACAIVEPTESPILPFLPRTVSRIRRLIELPVVQKTAFASLIAYLGLKHPMFALIVGSPPTTSFLDNVMGHRVHAADNLNVDQQALEKIITPFRNVHVVFSFRLDNGQQSPNFFGWRIVAEEVGKGGIRASGKVTENDVMALHLDMDIKPPPAVTVEGHPMRGGKGGMQIDLDKYSSTEKIRAVRAYVQAIMDKVWETEHRVAFGPLFDVPAPDLGTSPPGLNLMDYFADQVLEWELTHVDEIMPVLEREDPKLARDLLTLKVSHIVEPIRYNRDGSQVELAYVARVLGLREQGLLASLRLLASVTGKTAPNKDLPYGRGGIAGRVDATGMGLAFAALEDSIARGLIPRGSVRFRPGTTVAIEGSGNVGTGAVKSFQKLGATVVSIAEFESWRHTLKRLEGLIKALFGMPTAGRENMKAIMLQLSLIRGATIDLLWHQEKYALFCPTGITPDLFAEMKDYAKQYRTLAGFERTPTGRRFFMKKLRKRDFWKLRVDYMIPAAVENVLDAETARLINAKTVVEGANGPTTRDGDDVLQERGIPVVVDVVANSGGVLVSWMEILQNIEENGRPWTEAQVFEKLHGLIRDRITSLYAYINEHEDKVMRDAVHEIWLLNRLAEEAVHATQQEHSLNQAA